MPGPLLIILATKFQILPLSKDQDLPLISNAYQDQLLSLQGHHHHKDLLIHPLDLPILRQGHLKIGLLQVARIYKIGHRRVDQILKIGLHLDHRIGPATDPFLLAGPQLQTKLFHKIDHLVVQDFRIGLLASQFLKTGLHILLVSLFLKIGLHILLASLHLKIGLHILLRNLVLKTDLHIPQKSLFLRIDLLIHQISLFHKTDRHIL